MMGDMDGIDLEELEERLYSQIYHSTNVEEPQIPQGPQNEEIAKQTFGKPRYYEHSPSAVFSENKTHEQLTKINDAQNPAEERHSTDRINDENVNPCLISPQTTEGKTSLNVSVNEPSNSFNVPQFIGISPKEENAALKPPNRISNLSRKSRMRTKRKVDNEIKYLNIDKSKILENYEFIKQTSPHKLKKLKVINKRLRYLINKKMKLKEDKEDKLINKHNADLDSEVVQISSDDDMTIIIKENSPVKKMKVESEKIQDDDDDVVFVKQIFTEIETIVLDPECSQKTDSQLMKPPSDETSSIGSSNSSNLDKSTKPQSQVELLGTPDSTNDFLDNPIEMNQLNFNFALHGPEFGTPQSSKFLKPKPLNDVYESESSCSASDISTPYKKYSSVFSENEFDSSKEMFNESNLETFSKLITPKRKPAAAKRIETQTSEFEQIKTKVNSTSDMKTNSDSSSESEYEDTKIQQIEKKKNLNLSSSLVEDLATEIPVGIEEKNSKKKNKKSMPIEEIDDHTKFLQHLTEKRRKRKSELMGKIDDEDSQEENSQVQIESCAKKSKKNKGKAVVDNVDVEDNIEKEEDIKVKRKRKTRTDFAEDLVSTAIEENICKDSSPMKTKSGDFYIDESSMQDVIEVKDCPQSNNLVDLTTDESDILDITDFIVIDECGDSGGEDKKPDVQCTESNWQTEVVNVKLPEKSNGNQKPKNKLSFIDFWTEDMDKFYGSWGLEDFNVEDRLKTMSGDPEMWKIIDSDRLHIPTYRRGPFCRKCGKYGHVYTRAGYCPNAVPKCFLCGESGHFEPRCPNKICTMCGVKSNYSTTYCSKCVFLREVRCQICSMIGHGEQMCPDTWRRYHLTTEEGPIVIPERKDRLKPVEKQWCSGCARSGHLEYQCRYLNRMYAPTLPYVIDYTDVYGFTQKPKEDSIDFAEDILSNTYINDPHDTIAKVVEHKIRTKRSSKRNDSHYIKFLANLQIDKKRKGGQKQKTSSNCLDNSNSEESIKATNIVRKPKKAPFKGFPSNPSDIALKISTSLNNLQDWNSKENCFSIYNNILNLENSPETSNQEDLAQNFIKLNSLLVTKYKVMGSKGQKHLNILKSWLDQNKGTTVKDVLNHSLVNTIRNSYYYIFDAHRKKFNYKVLLGKIKTSEFPDARNVTFTLNDIGGGIGGGMGSKIKRRRYFNSKRLKPVYHM